MNTTPRTDTSIVEPGVVQDAQTADLLRATASTTHGDRALSRLGLSRRQFVVLVAGGAASLVVASGFRPAASGPAVVVAGPPTPTSFGSVHVVRAGRSARLAAGGVSALHPTPGPGAFGLAGAGVPVVRSVVAAHGGTGSSAENHHSGRGSDPGSRSPQPLNRTSGDVVLLEIEVHNAAASPLLFSPGDLRLTPANGQSITPWDASRGFGPIEAGASETLWVSYLAASDAEWFSAEFADPGADTPVVLRVPEAVWAGTTSAAPARESS